MSGTSPGGWPYVTPDDHPAEFPSHSQQLAQQLDAVATRAYVVAHVQAGTAQLDANGAALVTFPTRFPGPARVVATYGATGSATGGDWATIREIGVTKWDPNNSTPADEAAAVWIYGAPTAYVNWIASA